MKQAIQDIDFAEGAMLLVNKPLGITSFGLVFQIKNWLNSANNVHLIKNIMLDGKRRRIKIGHAGTLDPLANGLMIVCTGKWTKRINEFMGMDKTYTGTFRLGYTTPSYDLEQAPENPQATHHISAADIKKIKEQFIGDIQQLPPAFSAIKQDGKTSYDLAREGKEVTLAPRLRTIYSLELDARNLPYVHFEVRCSSGTYIRSLAHDIGQALGCGAYLSKLSRTAIGDYQLADAYSLQEMKDYFGSEAKLRVIEAQPEL